jgi:hypothetical protein
MPITVNISTAFINDTDTPATYTGQGGKTLQVNVTEDGLEFVTGSGANIYNANGTLTGNRTVTNSGFTLSFNGKTQVISPSASVLDTAFSVRSFGNTDYIFKQLGNGEWLTKVTKAGGVFEYNFTDVGNGASDVIYSVPNGSNGSQYWIYNGAVIHQDVNVGTELWSRKNAIRWKDLASSSTQLIKNTLGEYLFCNDATNGETPDTDVRVKILAAIGKTALKTVGKVNFNTLPTSSVGLSAGDLWNDSGTIKIV